MGQQQFRWILFALLPVLLPAADGLPIEGIAHVSFRVSDLGRARGFYEGILGYAEAFRAGEEPQAAAYFKVSDGQFIRIVANLGEDEDERLDEIALESRDVERLHELLRERGLDPSPVAADETRAKSFVLSDPDGHRIRFIEYTPDSLQAGVRGRFLGNSRISTHLRHTGVTVADERRADAFWKDKLGFVEIWRGGPDPRTVRWVNVKMPGARGDYIEYMLHDEPPNRNQLGSMHHICLEVADIQEAYRRVAMRGYPDSDGARPRIGRIRKWLFSVFDPDGSRTEYMEPDTVD
jgi:lactoylglutathione lyase